MRIDVQVVVLAGGEGRRIGGGKPLQRLGGERLIDRALRQARRWGDAVAVAVRDPGQVQTLDADLVADAEGVPGPLAGLVAGLRHAEAAGRPLLLTIPADTPFLPVDLLDRLHDAIADRHCAIAASAGALHPACALWRVSAVAQVPAYLATAQRSLRGFAELVGFAAVNWPAEPFDPFFNVNTGADLIAAARRLNA